MNAGLPSDYHLARPPPSAQTIAGVRHMKWGIHPIPANRCDPSVRILQDRAATVRECPMARGGPPYMMKTRRRRVMKLLIWAASSLERNFCDSSFVRLEHSLGFTLLGDHILNSCRDVLAFPEPLPNTQAVLTASATC
jgi:hypothetical protein